MTGLTGRVALVTGAASGVGRAVTLRYLKAGAAVVAVDVNETGLADLAAYGDALRRIPADVRDPAALAAAVDSAVSSFGGLDVVAAIAGVSRTGSLLSMSDADRDFIFGVNVIGVWNTVRAALPAIQARGPGGRVLACGSIESVLGGAGLAAYVSSKHALVGLIKSVALECAPSGITANVVSPAGVDTEMLRTVVPPEDIAHIAATTPVARLCQPDEVAAFFEFLAGPDAGYITGANVVVDGGVALLNSHTFGRSWAS
jgi:NAD(P)-dependent dehydrogenase (short-subunit alcohol dehydrogenase family)